MADKMIRAGQRFATLGRVSLAAMAVVLAAQPAAVRAQSFQATGSTTSPSTFITTGPGVTSILVSNAETIIDWSPTDVSGTGSVNFQTAGTTATFDVFGSGPALTDYTVLNRIQPRNALGAPTARSVTFNGTVNSLLNGVRGGNIWFYSPTGIVLGSTATFNVGSLVLTTDAIDTTGGLYGPGSSIRFRGTAGSTGSVVVNPGASIQATGKGTSQYVALVAPRVVQGGTINVDGQTALVAAEQADISINTGLLDIVVSQGTEDANGIVHTGTTTGPASDTAADRQVIQMVAMPKNTALTMMLSGTIGYAPAALASNEGSAVVLSAGFGSYVPRATQALALGNMTIADATIRNALTANATDTIKVQPTATNAVSFQADASLTAGKRIDVIADDDSLVSATGKLDLKAGLFESGGTVNVRAINTTLTSPVGRITVGGDLTIDASGAADPTDPTPAIGAAVTGGTVLVEAQRGSVASAGLTIRANAQSADALTTAGNALGGKITVQTSAGGSVAAGIVDLQARGTGGNADTQGGRGSGGIINVLDQGGSLNFSDVTASTVGRGGVANTAAGRGGDGFGGAVMVDIQGNSAGWSRLTADASAVAGLPLTPGSHSGNAFSQNEAILLHVGNGANFYIQGDITLDANALAGIDGTLGNAFADAGGIDVQVDGKATLYSGGISGATGNIIARADARIDAQTYRPDVQVTPDTFGGLISITANDGAIRLDHIFASATAEGAGAANLAGQAQGGSIAVGAFAGGQISVNGLPAGSPIDPFGAGNLTLDASVTGAAGPSSANATGGSVSLYTENGTIAVNGMTTLRANAGASQFDGLLSGGAFAAKGGTAILETRLGTGTGSITLADVAISADGANNGSGGDGEGGTAQVAVDGDQISAQALTLSANGIGGLNGAGKGGLASLTATNGGMIQALSTGLFAQGTGGTGNVVGGTAGQGVGGSIAITDTGSQLDLGQVQIGVRASGGAAALAGSTAGDALGGTVNIDITSDQPAWSTLNVDASVVAGRALGSGGLGGNAQGSNKAITLHVGGGGILATAATLLDASATGAFDGAAGSFAKAGSINVLIDGGGSWEVQGDLTATAAAAFNAFDYSPATQRSAANTGGTIDILANGGTLTAQSLVATAWAEGAGVGTQSGTANGGKIQVGATNGGRLTIAPLSGTGGMLLDARGLGSSGPTRANAQGGSARVYVQDGQIDVTGATLVRAGAEAGQFNRRADGDGFDALGGTAVVEMLAGTGMGRMTLQGVTVDATGNAAGNVGDTLAGNGGTGRGGTARAAIGDGVFTADSLLVQAGGQGGNSAPSTTTGFQSGNGFGGTSSFTQSGGTGTLAGALKVSARGTGGGLAETAEVGELVAAAGNGTGGNAALTISAGTLAVNDLTLDAGGLGGVGMGNANGVATETGGAGGNGSGGSAALSMPPGSTTANLQFVGGVSVLANGLGGNGGLSGISNLKNGAAGASTGGAARMALADGRFTFGNTTVSGSGGLALGPFVEVNGFDPVTGLPITLFVQTTGTSTAGSAAFELVDSVAGPAGRSLFDLNLRADGTGFGTAAALTRFRASVLSPTAGLTINGNFVASSQAYDPVLKGFDGRIDGASVIVNGLAGVFSASSVALDVAAGQRFDVANALTMSSSGANLKTTGLIRSGGLTQINGQTGVNMTDLESGGDTDLTAPFGALVVSHNLRSTGVVRATAQSIDLTSLGALSFTTAKATAGDLAIRTAGNLDATAVSATGQVGLTSDTGAIHTTGAITGNGITLKAAGNVLTDAAVTSAAALSVETGGSFTAGAPVSAAGNVAISATQGITAAQLTSGGTTQLAASNGAIAITTDLVSPGAVTANGRSVNLVSSGPLTFTGLTASAGNATVTAVGNLTVLNASASGTLNLTSSTGDVASSGTLVAGGSATIQGNTGITLNGLQSGAATTLQASNGALAVQALSSLGAVSAQARSVAIQSPGALSFTTAQATAGNLSIQTAGNLDAAAVSASGTTSLTSSAGAIRTTGLVSGNGVTLSAGGNVAADAGITSNGALSVQAGGSFTTGAPVSAAGNVAISATQGITAAQLTSGGTTQLAASNGAIAITTDLVSPGAVTANGRSVTIVSSGPLAFAGLTASAGNATVTAAGNLTVASASASGTLSLTSSGGAVASSGTLSAGGNLAVNGSTGVTLNSVQSGGTTSLQSANGDVTVAALTSAGVVSAQGRSLSIKSPGSLSFAQAKATAGSVLLQTAGDLAVATVDASGAVTLTSTGGAFAASGPISGSDVSLNAATSLTTGAITASGAIQATSRDGMTIGGDATAGAGLTLSSTAGTLTTRKLSGSQIALLGRDGIQIDGALSRGTLSAQTNGMFRMRGFSTGTAITVTSGDIDLGANNLGQRGFTQSIVLQNSVLSNRTFVGGADNSGGYSLSAAEALQLFADKQITIKAPDNGGPADMIVGNLALAFGSNLGAGATLKLVSTGRIVVQGAVDLRTVSAADTFAIDPTDIDIVTDTGSIGLLSASNAPLGTLNLQAGTIRVANAATIAALRSAGSLQQINTLLDQPASNPRANGYLVAGSIAFDVTSGLFIQNSGLSTAYADRRGFTAGAVSIRTGGATTQIAINGQTLDPAGIVVTGLNTARTLLINGAVPAAGGAFDALSSVNGCVIGLDCTFVPGLRPGRDTLIKPLSPEGTGSGGTLGIMPLISIAPQQENGSPPLIDEPVTGVGNDDLWQGACPPGEVCQNDAANRQVDQGAQ
ncbi:beta strand repeat-containing protein [Novosphingobium sp. B 225]|uniref:beta strand repeat-containing protein n=1 Tax=Novosphingobium sp. B 225 TaxID=1961849 RepID=UPI001124D04D|nr:hypothetical protein [Novosphingobium sp. B 225]